MRKKELKKKQPLAVLCADLHLSLKKPACRMEEDWMEVQARYLKQLRAFQVPPVIDGKQSRYPLPVLCAGDIFDHWNAPPELIRFALDHLPDGMISVPGQHDLPNHRTEEIHRSAYGVLVRAGKIIDADGRIVSSDTSGSVLVHGFGWNREIRTPEKKSWLFRVALVHRFIWTIGTGYFGAPESQHLERYMNPLKGYDVAVFGDNHIAFSKRLKTGTLVWNCGGFIRRRSDEDERRPRVGILFDDGSVEERWLDVSQDRLSPREESDERKLEAVRASMKSFLGQLESLGEHGLDFRDSVRRFLDSHPLAPEVQEIVRQIILQSLDEKR